MLERVLADWPLKLLALVLAFTLWVSITGEDQAVRDLDLPVAVRLDPENILANTPLKTVSVRLQGPRTVIRNLDPVELSVQIDLRGSSPGDLDVQLNASHIAGLPRRVSVTFFEPARLGLAVARRMRRELPVTPELVGEPPAGFTVYEARVQPGRVTIEGPEDALSALTQLRTTPLRLEHRTRTFHETASVVVDRPEIRLVDPQPLEVQVVVDVKPVRRTFTDVPIELASARRLPRPGHARVVVSGPPEIVQRLTADQSRVFAEPDGEAEAAVEASVIDLPDEQLAVVRVVSVQPARIGLERRSTGG